MIPSLSSERLIYKSLTLEHCTLEYVGWLNNPEVNKFLETGDDYTIELLENFLENVAQKETMLFWAIHLKESNKHIGNIKIDPVNQRHGLGEYGIMMGDTSEWGKGYAKEASKTIINYCFKELEIRKITLGVVEQNIAALNLYKTLGFTIEGVYKNHGLYNGKYMDILRMALFNNLNEK